jgi:hypothetical protein
VHTFYSRDYELQHNDCRIRLRQLNNYTSCSKIMHDRCHVLQVYTMHIYYHHMLPMLVHACPHDYATKSQLHALHISTPNLNVPWIRNSIRCRIGVHSNLEIEFAQTAMLCMPNLEPNTNYHAGCAIFSGCIHRELQTKLMLDCFSNKTTHRHNLILNNKARTSQTKQTSIVENPN